MHVKSKIALSTISIKRTRQNSIDKLIYDVHVHGVFVAVTCCSAALQTDIIELYMWIPVGQVSILPVHLTQSSVVCREAPSWSGRHTRRGPVCRVGYGGWTTLTALCPQHLRTPGARAAM